jgi:hypothetical protein
VVAHVYQTDLAFAVAYCEDGAADGPIFASYFIFLFLASLQDINAVEWFDIFLLALLAFRFGFKDEFGFTYWSIDSKCLVTCGWDGQLLISDDNAPVREAKLIFKTKPEGEEGKKENIKPFNCIDILQTS